MENNEGCDGHILFSPLQARAQFGLERSLSAMCVWRILTRQLGACSWARSLPRPRPATRFRGEKCRIDARAPVWIHMEKLQPGNWRAFHFRSAINISECRLWKRRVTHNRDASGRRTQLRSIVACDRFYSDATRLEKRFLGICISRLDHCSHGVNCVQHPRHFESFEKFPACQTMQS